MRIYYTSVGLHFEENIHVTTLAEYLHRDGDMYTALAVFKQVGGTGFRFCISENAEFSLYSL